MCIRDSRCILRDELGVGEGGRLFVGCCFRSADASVPVQDIFAADWTDEVERLCRKLFLRGFDGGWQPRAFYACVPAQRCTLTPSELAAFLRFGGEGRVFMITMEALNALYSGQPTACLLYTSIIGSQMEVLNRVLRESGVAASEVACIGITNQRETTVLWDRKTGRPIYNAIVWQCRRTAPQCEQMVTDGCEGYIPVSYTHLHSPGPAVWTAALFPGDSPPPVRRSVGFFSENPAAEPDIPPAGIPCPR